MSVSGFATMRPRAFTSARAPESFSEATFYGTLVNTQYS